MRERTSICVATFNGERYLREQLDSIYCQLKPDDEVIIVDDASSDGTAQILSEYASLPNTEVVRLSHNVGHLKAFSAALTKTRNDTVVLSDQDDLWPDGRLDKLLSQLSEDCLLVTGSYETFGLEDAPTRLNSRNLGGPPNIANMLIGGFFGDVPYWGSCMAFRRDLLDVALPLPRWVEAHDQWLVILANVMGRTHHTDEIVTWRRLHESNLSTRVRRPLLVALRGKVRLLACVFVAHYRARRTNGTK